LNSCVGRRYRRLSGPRGVAHLVYSENFVSPRAHTSRSSYGGPGGEGGAAAAAAAAARDVYAPGKIKYVEKYDGDAHARATRALSLSLSLSLSSFLSCHPSLSLSPLLALTREFGNFAGSPRSPAREVSDQRSGARRQSSPTGVGEGRRGGGEW